MDKIKETCDNCEHDNDSGQEYCGSCDGHTSNWVKARWILQETIDILQAENKKHKEQQLTEDEIKKIFGYSAIGFIHDMDCPCKADPDDGDSYDECKCEALNNFAKKIIEAREEKNG